MYPINNVCQWDRFSVPRIFGCSHYLSVQTTYECSYFCEHKRLNEVAALKPGVFAKKKENIEFYHTAYIRFARFNFRKLTGIFKLINVIHIMFQYCVSSN